MAIDLKDKTSIEELKKNAEKGLITDKYVDWLKNKYLNLILLGEEVRASTASVSYAHFLNSQKINSDNYPLYLDVLATNHKYAVDQLIEGVEPEKFLEAVIPNGYVISYIFQVMEKYKRNEVYNTVMRVLCGLLLRVYESSEEGYSLYKPSVTEINNLGKFLNEDKDQDDPLNRDLLDILLFITDLDQHHTTDTHKHDIARQAGRIRSDYFDNTRHLGQSLTQETLKKSENVTHGVTPEYLYG